MPLKQMTRLMPLVLDESGEAEVELQFERDFERRYIITGQIRSQVRLTCQRCMESYLQPLQIEVSLALVRDAVQAEQLPERYDPLLIEGDELFLRDLVEDELLLALPAVPRHLDDACAMDPAPIGDVQGVSSDDSETDPHGEEDEAPTPPNPFAILGRLKDK